MWSRATSFLCCMYLSFCLEDLQMLLSQGCYGAVCKIHTQQNEFSVTELHRLNYAVDIVTFGGMNERTLAQIFE